MELVKNNGRSREAAQSQPQLVTSVVGLAECLEEALLGKATLETVSNAVGTALTQARAAEHKIAEQIKNLSLLKQLAVTDDLTGMLNRRGFEGEIKRAMNSARRYKEKGVIIYIDLDGFKPINDTFGHAAGDQVLRGVGDLLADNVRATDYIGRLGGDEFGILLTRTDWNAGLTRAEFFDKLVNSAVVEWEGQMIAVKASFGFQNYGPNDDLDELLKRADDAMYVTKRARAAGVGTEPFRATA
ncbi:MAG: GGDEF domain-containing protein [Rhodospirillales bacterium]|nr:GGDEF domain-containing protein [Rhodospirillales bacterium]